MTLLLHSSLTQDASEFSVENQGGNPYSWELADTTWRQQVQRIQRETKTFYFAFKHPRVHWRAKLVAACTAGYLLSPVQLIPNFIPVIGWLDDLLVFVLGVKLLKKMIPVDVLTDCRERAKAAELQRKGTGMSMAAAIAFLGVAMVWLLAAITVTRLIALYMPLAKMSAP